MNTPWNRLHNFKRSTYGAITLRIATPSITTFSIKGLFATLNKTDTQRKLQSAEQHSAIMLNVVIQSVVMLNIIIISVVAPNIILTIIWNGQAYKKRVEIPSNLFMISTPRANLKKTSAVYLFILLCKLDHFRTLYANNLKIIE